MQYFKQFKHILPALVGAGVLLPLGLAINYGLNIVLARFLSVEDYGLFGYVHSLVTILALVAGLGFSNSMVRLLSAYRVQQHFDLLRGAVVGSFKVIVAAGFCVLAFLLITRDIVWSDNQQAVYWTALLLLPFTIAGWRQSCMRGLQKTVEAIVPRDVLLPLLTLLLVYLFEIQKIGQVLIIYFSVLVVLELVGLIRLKTILSDFQYQKPRFDYKHWLDVSIPMGLSNLARQGILRWDIIIVGIFVGLDATGQYTAASRTALLVVVALRVINLAVGPYIAEAYHAQDYQRFRSLIGLSTVCSIALGAPFYLLVMYYPALIMSIFGEAYTNAGLILQILVTGQFINLITGPVGLALNMAAHQKANLILVCCSAILSLVGLLIFVPKFGVVAAAWVTAATGAMLNLSLLGYLYFFVFRQLKIR